MNVCLRCPSSWLKELQCDVQQYGSKKKIKVLNALTWHKCASPAQVKTVRQLSNNHETCLPLNDSHFSQASFFIPQPNYALHPHKLLQIFHFNEHHSCRSRRLTPTVFFSPCSSSFWKCWLPKLPNISMSILCINLTLVVLHFVQVTEEKSFKNAHFTASNKQYSNYGVL